MTGWREEQPAIRLGSEAPNKVAGAARYMQHLESTKGACALCSVQCGEEEEK